MSDDPARRHARRIEARLNAIVVLLGLLTAAVRFHGSREVTYSLPYLLIIVVFALLVVASAVLVGAWGARNRSKNSGGAGGPRDGAR